MFIHEKAITKNEYNYLIRKNILTLCKNKINKKLERIDQIINENDLKILINELNSLLENTIKTLEINNIKVSETFKRMEMFTYLYSPFLEENIIIYPELYYEFMKGID